MKQTLSRARFDRVLSAVGFAIAALLASGCDSGGLQNMVPIKGEVIYNGKPLPEGQVVYLPVTAGEGRQAGGPIQSDGTFVMTTQDKADGVMEGEYNIVIYAYKSDPKMPTGRAQYESFAESEEFTGQYLIPERYVNPNTSQLSDKVDGSHSGFHRIELNK